MLRLPGHGDAGPGGGRCGDLYIRFRVTICSTHVPALVLVSFLLLPAAEAAPCCRFMTIRGSGETASTSGVTFQSAI